MNDLAVVRSFICLGVPSVNFGEFTATNGTWRWFWCIFTFPAQGAFRPVGAVVSIVPVKHMFLTIGYYATLSATIIYLLPAVSVPQVTSCTIRPFIVALLSKTCFHCLETTVSEFISSELRFLKCVVPRPL